MFLRKLAGTVDVGAGPDGHVEQNVYQPAQCGAAGHVQMSHQGRAGWRRDESDGQRAQHHGVVAV